MKGVEFSAAFRDRVVMREIVEELAEARAKFKDNKRQLLALNEEVGELNQACMELENGGINKKTGKPYTAQEVFNEAVQVAAMAIRVVTEGDRICMPNYKFPFDDLNRGR